MADEPNTNGKISLSFTTTTKKAGKSHQSFDKNKNKNDNKPISHSITDNTDDLFTKTVDVKIIPCIKQTKWRTTDTKPPPLEQENNDNKLTKEQQEGLDLILQNDATNCNNLDNQSIILAPSNPNGTVAVGAFNQMKLNQVPGIEDVRDIKKKFELDFAQRPSEPDLNDYNDMPMSSFGAAMLLGMGWNKTVPVGNQYGNNHLIIPKIIDSKPRPKNLGLGATVSKVVMEKMINRKFNPHKPRTKKQEEKIKQMQQWTKSGDFEPPKKKLKLSQNVNQDLNRMDIDMKRKYKKKKKRKRKRKIKAITWIKNGLKVRVINKSSNYYKKKGFVDDVIDGYQFTLRMNDNILLTLYQEDVETVIPKVGEFVMVLYGKNKNLRGTILNKYKQKQYSDVQLEENLSIIKCDYDDICAI